MAESAGRGRAVLRYAITESGVRVAALREAEGLGGAGEAPPLELRLRHMAALVERWAGDGVECIQVREKDLDIEQRAGFAGELARVANSVSLQSRVIVNLGGLAGADRNRCLSRCAALGVRGVHLPGSGGRTDGWDSRAVEEARTVLATGGAGANWVSVAVHRPQEAFLAQTAGVDAVLFGPVFEKPLPGGQPALAGKGVAVLAEVVRQAGSVPVFALGGITAENAGLCVAAGAVGVAGIRLFS